MWIAIAVFVFHYLLQDAYRKAAYAQHKQEVLSGNVPEHLILPGPEAVDAPLSLFIFTIVFFVLVSVCLAIIPEFVKNGKSRFRDFLSSVLEVGSVVLCTALVMAMASAQYDLDWDYKPRYEMKVAEVYVEEGDTVQKGARLFDYQIKATEEEAPADGSDEIVVFYAPIDGRIQDIWVKPAKSYYFLAEKAVMKISGEVGDLRLKVTP